MKKYIEIINNHVAYSFHEFPNDFIPQYDSDVLTMLDITHCDPPPKQGDYAVSVSGRFTGEFISPQRPVPTKEEIKKEIRTRYAAQMATIASPYQLEERETWFTQIMEADEWLTDNTIVTPMLTAMATERGITIGDLVGKIKENDSLFRQAIGTLLGRQQKELDSLG